MSYSVAQNATFLTFASIVQKIVSFGYFTLVARLIGVGNTGSYFFAITFTTIFTVVAEFGLAQVLTREAAKYPENSEKYFNTILWTKIVFGVVAYVLVVVFTTALGYSPLIRDLIFLSGVTMFFDNLQTTFFSIFRARKNLVYESFAIVLSQILTLIIGTTALFLHAPLIWLIAAYTIPSGLMLFYSSFFLRRVYGLSFNLGFDKLIFRQFFILAVPFALAGILGRLYSYSDSLIMSKMLTPEHLGWWSVPYKITFAFQFVPVALSASVYPAMSALTVSDPDKVGELFVKAWKYLFLAVFPLALGLIAVANPVIIKLFGPQYLPSVPVLRILLVSLIFSYLSIISGSLLNATNHQKVQTGLIGAALISNIILNLILIPILGIVGAALAALASNVLLWSLGYYYVNKFVVIKNDTLIKTASKVFLLALTMAILVYLLTLRLSFVFTIPFGLLIYGVLLFFTGAIDRTAINSAFGKIFPRKAL